MRAYVQEEMNKSYKGCIKATRAYFYYKDVAECTKHGEGEGIGGGCAHVSGYRVVVEESELGHCKILKPTVEDMSSELQRLVISKGIEQCAG